MKGLGRMDDVLKTQSYLPSTTEPDELRAQFGHHRIKGFRFVYLRVCSHEKRLEKTRNFGRLPDIVVCVHLCVCVCV